jgi:hypothetical protein
MDGRTSLFICDNDDEDDDNNKSDAETSFRYVGAINQYHHPRFRHCQQQTIRCFAGTGTAAADTRPLDDIQQTKRPRVVVLGTPGGGRPNRPRRSTSRRSNNHTRPRHARRWRPNRPRRSTSRRSNSHTRRQSSSSSGAVSSLEIVSRSPRSKLESRPVRRAAEVLNTPEKAKQRHDLSCAARLDLCVTAAYGQYFTRRFILPTSHLGHGQRQCCSRGVGAAAVCCSARSCNTTGGDDRLLYKVRQLDAGPIIAQQEYYCHNNTHDDDDDSIQS